MSLPRLRLRSVYRGLLARAALWRRHSPELHRRDGQRPQEFSFVYPVDFCEVCDGDVSHNPTVVYCGAAEFEPEAVMIQESADIAFGIEDADEVILDFQGSR